MTDDRGSMLPKVDRPVMFTAIIIVVLGNELLFSLPQAHPLVASLFVVPIAIGGVTVNYLLHGRIWLYGRGA